MTDPEPNYFRLEEDTAKKQYPEKFAEQYIKLQESEKKMKVGANSSSQQKMRMLASEAECLQQKTGYVQPGLPQAECSAESSAGRNALDFFEERNKNRDFAEAVQFLQISQQ